MNMKLCIISHLCMQFECIDGPPVNQYPIYEELMFPTRNWVMDEDDALLLIVVDLRLSICNHGNSS